MFPQKRPTKHSQNIFHIIYFFTGITFFFFLHFILESPRVMIDPRGPSPALTVTCVVDEVKRRRRGAAKDRESPQTRDSLLQMTASSIHVLKKINKDIQLQNPNCFPCTTFAVALHFRFSAKRHFNFLYTYINKKNLVCHV